MWAFSNLSIVELPLKVAMRLMPQRSKRSSSTKASPPMLYSPSMATLNLPARRRVVAADDVLEQAVVGDVVAGRLAHAAVALATEGEDVDAELLLHFAGHGVDVVADQPHGAGRKDGDRLGMEDVVGLLDRLPQPLHAAEDDVLLLHVGGEAVGNEVVVLVGGRLRLVAARQPGVEPAADRPVGDVDDVAGGAEHHAFAAGVGASALRDDAGMVRTLARFPA